MMTLLPSLKAIRRDGLGSTVAKNRGIGGDAPREEEEREKVGKESERSR